MRVPAQRSRISRFIGRQRQRDVAQQIGDAIQIQGFAGLVHVRAAIEQRSRQRVRQANIRGARARARSRALTTPSVCEICLQTSASSFQTSSCSAAPGAALARASYSSNSARNASRSLGSLRSLSVSSFVRLAASLPASITIAAYR